MKHNLFVTISLLAAFLAAPLSPVFPAVIPETGAIAPASQPAVAPAASRVLATRIAVAGVFSYEVVQQPSGNAGYVSSREGEVTQFRMASQYGSQGFLAHNNLAGAAFFGVEIGDIINVTYSDGEVAAFEVVKIRHLQATRPTSPYSRFVDLDNGGSMLTAAELFYDTYGIENTLVMQTCIAKAGEQSWGRLFIIAKPAQRGQMAQ